MRINSSDFDLRGRRGERCWRRAPFQFAELHGSLKVNSASKVAFVSRISLSSSETDERRPSSTTTTTTTTTTSSLLSSNERLATGKMGRADVEGGKRCGREGRVSDKLRDCRAYAVALYAIILDERPSCSTSLDFHRFWISTRLTSLLRRPPNALLLSSSPFFCPPRGRILPWILLRLRRMEESMLQGTRS